VVERADSSAEEGGRYTRFVSKSTAEPGYAARLDELERRRLARWFDVQAPYRRNIRRMEPGFVLDVGCGLGRNLRHLDGNGVGIDHNADSVEVARSRGLTVFTPDEFRASQYAVPGRFDSLLLAHVVEHLDEPGGRDLVVEHLPFVKPDGRVILICPQQAGFRSDDTHVTYYDREGLVRFAESCGLEAERPRSFPFPTVVGRVFPYNETIVVARRPA
jgi:2-polyprenyl-3-methyl-5-hydroxy-6-metoxy-1,4-benzoquinol methylase